MATLKDIAKEAEVTVMTVSNVINGKFDKVSQATVERVTEIAHRLDYVPSATARSLVAKTSRLVGVLLPASEDEGIFLSTHNVVVIGAIERLLREKGYYLLLRGISAADGVAGTLKSWNLDGAILIGFLDSEIQKMRSSFDTPLVVLESYAAHGDFMTVRLNDREGGYQATKHLIGNGHRKIAFVGTPMAERGVDRERYEGYLQALKEAGITGEPTVLPCPTVSHAMGVEAGRRLGRNYPEITAAFATADQLAVGLIEGLHAVGRSVPDDLSIVGFDDLEIAATSRPPLTTITQDLKLKAATAVNLLLHNLQETDDQPQESVLDVHLVERKSVRKLESV